MPIWSEILEELNRTGEQGQSPPFDFIRRKYLTLLHEHTARNIILYASGWIQRPGTPPEFLTISDEDVQALMEVTQGLTGTDVDLILHSPGGSPEAAEAIVSYLRSRFSHIRVVVPHLAMSAATMLACAANEIVLGKHSFLSPTDPQLLLATPLGVRSVPAQAMLDQFDRAQRECEDPARLPAWLPMLAQYGPDLLTTCDAALRMSRQLVSTWLENYMFVNQKDGRRKAANVSDWLADHEAFKSHARHISREALKAKELIIIDLEADELLQDLCLSVFHATTHTFAGTSAVKLVENHTGRAFIKHHVPQQLPAHVMQQATPIPPTPLDPLGE